MHAVMNLAGYQDVLAKDAARNRVTVGTLDELAVREVVIGPATLYREGGRVDRVKLRYRSEPVPCMLAAPAGRGSHDSLTVSLAAFSAKTSTTGSRSWSCTCRR